MQKLVSFVAMACLLGCQSSSLSAPMTPKPESSQVRPVAIDASKASIEQTVRILANDIGERNIDRYEALEKSRQYITARLENAGYTIDLNTYQSKEGEKDVHNIVATLPGSEEILVVGAHYDSATLTPGANDNGSGTAVLLQLAERLKDTKLKRTVRFVFFTNEEPPYFMTSDMGSAVYARRCAQRGDKIVGMISLETMGYFSDEPGSQHFPPGIEGYPDTGNFLAFISDAKSEGLLRECLANFEGVPTESLVAGSNVEGVSWSDHASFWTFNYPAIMITDTAPFRYPHYHRESDTPEKLNYPKLESAAAGLEKVLRALGRVEKQSP